MRRTALFVYLGFPAVMAGGAFMRGLQNERFAIDMFIAYVLGGGLFYLAPHLLWLVIATLGKFQGIVWHAGFVAASAALAAVLVLAFTFHDPSGLPYQWLIYWPLALVLQAVLVGASFLVSRRHLNVDI